MNETDIVDGKKDSFIKNKTVVIAVLSGFLLILLSIIVFLLLRSKNTPIEDSVVNSENKIFDEVKRVEITEDLVMKEDPADTPSWITNDLQKKADGPWYGSLSIATSNDGLLFEDEKLFLDHAGVAQLILTDENVLVAVFQYFSYQNEELFDRIAYTTSSDLGKTWSEVALVSIVGLKPGPNPVDPTLVQLEDSSFRLYFTYHEVGNKYPQLFSARSETLDGDFVNEGIQLETDFIVLDPAVVKFDGKWHHFSVKHGEVFDEAFGAEKLSIHSVSEDGIDFVLVDNIDIGMQFLGNVIPFEDGLRFYGDTGESAYSDDGYTWEYEPNTGPMGADPGVVQLPDGSYLAIFSKR